MAQHGAEPGELFEPVNGLSPARWPFWSLCPMLYAEGFLHSVEETFLFLLDDLMSEGAAQLPQQLLL